jgi:hypothetical protein
MMMNVEQSVEWELAEETEVLGENLPQCHLLHHKQSGLIAAVKVWTGCAAYLKEKALTTRPQASTHV